MTEQYIGVDLGGTRIRAALLDEQLQILERKETLTLADEGLDATLQRMKDLITAVMPSDRVESIGFSVPGPMNPMTGVVVAPPNLPGWHNVPLADIMHEAFDVPVYVGNDANVAILAEATRGAVQGCANAIYITVSTGIGSGILTEGRLLLGQEGLAAEAGHIALYLNDGRVSTLEKEASGTGIARHAQERLAGGVTSMMLDVVDGDIEKIDAKVVGQCAHEGDPLALEIVTYAGTVLGLGFVTLLHLFNPDAIVVGGGVSKIGDLLFDPAKQAIRQYTLDEAYWRDLRIEMAALGEDVSIYGAAALAKSKGGQSSVQEVVASLRS